MANYLEDCDISEKVQSLARSLNLIRFVVTASLSVVVALALSEASEGVGPSKTRSHSCSSAAGFAGASC